MNICISVVRPDYDACDTVQAALLRAFLRTCKNHNLDVEHATVCGDTLDYSIKGRGVGEIRLTHRQTQDLYNRRFVSVLFTTMDTPF